jgi:UDP-GlcNAc:undecaprenyl-phosphate/decaprenyl-phosphate GlcNAc-1-phosphate transferase
MILFYSIITAMLVSLLMIPPLIHMAKKYQLIDIPNERKVHTGHIPRVGGIAMVVGVVLSLSIWLDFSDRILAYLLGVFIIAIFGTWDDKVQLDHRIKFVGQIIASLVVVIYGEVIINQLPFIYDGIIPDFIAIPFTIFALLGVTNAVNLSDGLDGLAGGCCLLSFAVIGVLGFMSNDLNFVTIVVAVIGATLGFLRFNTYPATVFMGDTGSQFLGFSLGVLIIWLTQSINPVMSPAIALLILGFPILDTLIVMSRRILSGKSPFKPDKKHIHHKLLDMGLDHYEAVSIIYVVQSCIVISGYFFRFYNDYEILFSYFLFSLVLIILFNKAEINNFKFNRTVRESIAQRLFKRDGGRMQLIRFCGGIGVIIMLIYFLLISTVVKFIPDILVFIISALLAAVIFSIITDRKKRNLVLLRIILYLISTIIIYLSNINLEFIYEYNKQIAAIYLVFIFVTFIGLVLPEKGRKSISPLDYIIVFAIIVLSNLPAYYFGDTSKYAVDIAKLFILFYLSEFILMSVQRHDYILKSGLIFTLSILMLKSII